MAVAITQPRAQHQQPAEEHRVASRNQASRVRRRMQIAQHARQRRHDNGNPENIGELDQAQRRHPQPDALADRGHGGCRTPGLAPMALQAVELAVASLERTRTTGALGSCG